MHLLNISMLTQPHRANSMAVDSLTCLSLYLLYLSGLTNNDMVWLLDYLVFWMIFWVMCWFCSLALTHLSDKRGYHIQQTLSCVVHGSVLPISQFRSITITWCFLMICGSSGFLYWSSLSVLSSVCLPPVNACLLLLACRKMVLIESEQFSKKKERRGDFSVQMCEADMD